MSTVPEPELILEEDDFWEKYKTPLLAGTGLFVACALGFGVWTATTQAKAEAAAREFAQADSIESWENVVSAHPGSMPAADAILRIAAAQRDAGELDKSTASFRQFVELFPEHPLAGGALLGVAQNQDAAGQSAEARATCQSVVTTYPDSFAAPYAAYMEAEILLRDFQKDEARRSFNMVTTQFPSSPVARMAAGQLSRLGPDSAAGSPR